MPGLGARRAAELTPGANRAMLRAGITTEKRAAAFLAQIGHESGSLVYKAEIASGAAYEGRSDLGNTQRGDGVRFKGRGFIGCTGRANYLAMGRWLGVGDLFIRHPTLLERDDWAWLTAVWFWSEHGLNRMADEGRFDAITRRINGGYHGKADRDARWAHIKQLGGAVRPSWLYHLTALERKHVSRYFYHRRRAAKRSKLPANMKAVSRGWARYHRGWLQGRRRLLWAVGRARGWRKNRRGVRHRILFRLLSGWPESRLRRDGGDK